MKFVVCVVLCWFASECRGQAAWTMLPQSFSHISQMRFFDRDTGLLISSGQGGYGYVGPESTADSLLKTTNGGETWNDVLVPMARPYHLFDFYMLRGEIWLVCVGRSNGVPVRILHSTDIGNSWNIIAFDSMKYPFEIAFANRDTGYLLHQLDTSHASSKQYFTYPSITTDGGKSWAEFPLVASGWQYLKVGFASTVFLTLPNQNDPHPSAYVTFDYGASLKYSAKPDNILDEPDYCYCGDGVWIGGGGRSTDGGHTWGGSTVHKVWADTLRTVYTNSSISQDRGMTWDAIEGFTRTAATKVEVIDNLCAYRSTGTEIYKTTNSGGGPPGAVMAHESEEFNPCEVNSINGMCFINCQLPSGMFCLSDALGRTILSTRITQPETRIPLTGIPAGMYFYSYGGRVGKFVKMGTSEP